MAMVRTIQHPGVQIQETEIGSYNSPIVMNNAYIMGYADRGPIYDYSWIMNTRDFTKIYGEPQNEAEKYLFTAVQSVLTNGGTPIVARMPYDNKQCKAYKAMKLKWADITPNVDTDLTSPVIPLSALTKEINSTKNFDEIFTISSVTVNDKAVTSSYIEGLTISQIAKQLNPYKSGNANNNGIIWEDLDPGFKVNGVSPASLGVDQDAIIDVVDSLSSDIIPLSIKVKAYDAGYNKVKYNSVSAVQDGFISESETVWEIQNIYLKIPYVHWEYETSSAGIPDLVSSNLEAYIELFGDGKTFYYNENKVYQKDVVFSEEILSGVKNTNLSGWFNADGISGKTIKPEKALFKMPSSIEKYNELVNLSLNNIVYGDVIGYYAPSSTYGGNGIEQITKCNQKPIFGKKQFKEISGYFTATSIFTTDEFTKEPTNIENIGDIFKYFNGVSGANSGTILSETESFAGNISTDANGAIQINEKTASLTLIPIFKTNVNLVNGLDSKGNVYKGEDDEIIGYLNVDIESPGIFGTYIDEDGNKTNKKVYSFSNNKNDLADGNYEIIDIAGGTVNIAGGTVDIAGGTIELNEITTSIFDKTISKGKLAYNLVKLSPIVIKGSVNYIDSYKVTYAGYLNDVQVVKIDEDLMIKNPFLISLNTIYNSTKLLRKDEQEITRFDAKLLETPEMGFKYGLYLDGEDCEISNDQYDDLVTVNQFKEVDRTVDKYGHDIDDANFIIVDKQKTVVQGVGGNIGFFTVVIDPFDALKVQRLLVNPVEKSVSRRKVSTPTDSVIVEFDHSDNNVNNLDYWAYEAADSWNQIYDELLDSMDTLQRVRNADGIYVGEPNPIDGKLNILDSWAVPLTGDYYTESISKMIMRKFPGIPMADVNSDTLEDENYVPSVIDHQYSTHIMVAVCKTAIDQGTGKITVTLVETFFGSLFNEVSTQNGRSLFIGDIINGNSDYIEFYRNNYVSAGEQGAYDPPEYRRTEVNQIFIKDSADLKAAAQMRGIDPDAYGLDALNKDIREAAEAQYEADLAKKHIYIIDKKEVCIYNLHWEANFTSFSKKESQKIIANTSGLYSVSDGTTINVAKNFLIDMDRCINFIKNRDEIPIHFVCDAGLSTIAQFCDNIIWNPNKMTIVGEKEDPVTGKKTGEKNYVKTGGWITQPFNPDDDPDGDDRYITGYSDVATWRKVVEKLDSICSLIRKDCFAIIDAPRQLTLDGAAPKIRRTKFDNKFDKTIGRCLRYISGLNSSYCAGYYNWLRTTDQYTGRSIWIPPTSKIIGNYMYLNINNLPWLAPAGLTYGIITGCHAISHNPDYQEEDQIYMKSWNYIKQYPIEGFVVEGQKTMLGKESVFERINVRLLFLDLERFAYNVSRGFKYTVNNAYTREQFVATLKPKFEDYTLRGGIYEYLIKVDGENNTPETIDQNELRGDIFIKPARLIEYILLNFVGTSTGTDFNELPMG